MMNHNGAMGDYGVPEWACEIIEKHDLGLRADAPLSAAIVLLTDAAADLKEVSMTAFTEQALSPSLLCRMSEIVCLVEDARKLSALGSSEPEAGTVTASIDGTLRWHAAGPADCG